jgi:hypothetical protein
MSDLIDKTNVGPAVVWTVAERLEDLTRYRVSVWDGADEVQAVTTRSLLRAAALHAAFERVEEWTQNQQ